MLSGEGRTVHVFTVLTVACFTMRLTCYIWLKKHLQGSPFNPVGREATRSSYLLF